MFPSEDSTVSQLRYLTCSPDLSGFLFCFYIVNNSASWFQETLVALRVVTPDAAALVYELVSLIKEHWETCEGF